MKDFLLSDVLAEIPAIVQRARMDVFFQPEGYVAIQVIRKPAILVQDGAVFSGVYETTATSVPAKSTLGAILLFAGKDIEAPMSIDNYLRESFVLSLASCPAHGMALGLGHQDGSENSFATCGRDLDALFNRMNRYCSSRPPAQALKDIALLRQRVPGEIPVILESGNTPYLAVITHE